MNLIPERYEDFAKSEQNYVIQSHSESTASHTK